MSLLEGKKLVIILARNLLKSISEVTALVAGMEIEQESFMELGCYLERTSPVIMELQTTENTPPNATEILRSLSVNIGLAKDLVGKCCSVAHTIKDPELKSIIENLERVIQRMGRGLSLIPSSTFENHHYAEVAVRSLSREMQNASLQVGRSQISQSEEKNKQNSSYLEELEEREQPSLIETENYSVCTEASTECPQTSNSQVHISDMPRLINFVKGRVYNGQANGGNLSQPSKRLPQVAEYMEPQYETFFCPLTKKIMDDPVTLESGATYERRAIDEWITKFEGSSDDISCPVTGKKLKSRVFSTNIALKTTIEEWRERNEATRIKVARAALSLASSDNMIFEALKDLQILCQRKKYNKVQVCNIGMIPLLARFLDYDDQNVRFETLETLRLLAEEDEEGKELIAKTKSIQTTIKMLSSNHLPQRHAAISLLLELSRSEPLCEKIGSVTGAILLLITMKYDGSADAFSAEKATETLKNLEVCPKNIKCMAENGHLEPLLNHLIEGSEEMQMEMGSYLGEIVLGQDTKTHVAERASGALIRMVQSGNTLTRKVALKALVQISSYHPNSKILVDAGIVQIMIEEMFTRKIYNEPMDSKVESTAILANILESGLNIETLQANSHGHTMASDYIIYNIIHKLEDPLPDELSLNLLKILLCLMKSPKAMTSVVSAIKEADASYNLIGLINSPQEELSIASIKLLIAFSPHMGHNLADRLCKTRGQPENLIKKLETDRITEKHAVSVKLLANLPHQNLTLNLALLHKDLAPVILQRINDIQRGETRTSRFSSSYLEGLVGILVRFTTTLYDAQILFLARNFNLTSVFTELLMRTGNDEVQRLSAIGLENLSSESINLSKTPQVKRQKYHRILPKCFTFGLSKKQQVQLCPIHRGACSSQTTFCLLDAKALERLLACLDHENVEVVEAALSAICTLLDDKVDVDKSVSVLSEVNAIQHVLNVLREHRQDGVWKKSFWLIERFLMKGDKSSSDISEDRLLPSTLVSAFHHGDSNTRQMAGKILKHLNKMPTFSTNAVV